MFSEHFFAREALDTDHMKGSMLLFPQRRDVGVRWTEGPGAPMASVCFEKEGIRRVLDAAGVELGTAKSPFTENRMEQLHTFVVHPQSQSLMQLSLIGLLRWRSVLPC